jgi:YesN/AraC family two-component response regulator
LAGVPSTSASSLSVSGHVLANRMLDLIQIRYADVVTLRTLGALLERRPAHLGSLFRRELGMTARECLTRVRLAHATELILNGVKIEAVALTSAIAARGTSTSSSNGASPRRPKDIG